LCESLEVKFPITHFIYFTKIVNKKIYRISIATFLVLAVAAALIFSSPLPESFNLWGGADTSPPEGVTFVNEDTTADGEFTMAVYAESEDGNVELDIEEGTVGLTEKGRQLVYIEIHEMEDPPDPPEESEVIGLVYYPEPNGTAFDPPITLISHYDPDELPEGVSGGNLSLAVWNEDTGTWRILETTADPETSTLTSKVSHFTPFMIYTVM